MKTQCRVKQTCPCWDLFIDGRFAAWNSLKPGLIPVYPSPISVSSLPLVAIRSLPAAEFVLEPLSWNAKARVWSSPDLHHSHVFLLQTLLSPAPLALALFMLWVKFGVVSFAPRGLFILQRLQQGSSRQLWCLELGFLGSAFHVPGAKTTPWPRNNKWSKSAPRAQGVTQHFWGLTSSFVQTQNCPGRDFLFLSKALE